MPKILETVGGKWHSVGVPGEFANDDNFSYLSAFEELVYEENNRTDHKKKQKNLRLVRKKKAPVEDVQVKKKKMSINKTDEQSVESQDDVAATIESEDLVGRKEMVVCDEKPKEKKRPKKDRKRKLSKKHFPLERPSKKCYLDKEGVMKAVENDKPADPSTSRKLGEADVDLTLWHDFFLPDEVMQGLKELKFSAPTEIQSLVLPSAVRDKLDIIGAAETGSGKTLAYLIPVICRLLETEPVNAEKKLKALILAPTRELVVQIKKQLDVLLKYTKFKGVCIVGGLSQQKQERLMKYCPEVIVATPGRFWALTETCESNSYLSDWSFLRIVVVDETDRMMEKGHFKELEHILSRMKNEAPVKRQTLVFSATLTFVHLPSERLLVQQKGMTAKDKLNRLIDVIGLRPERKIFDITKSACTPETLVEARMSCSDLLEKDTNVVYLLTRYPGRTLIFTNSVDASRRLRGILSKVGYDGVILMIHAKMTQKQRLVNLENFSEADNSVLIATDVAARGLDIPGIHHVIHYQVARTAESYVHRSGRTARISHKGLAVMMVDPQDVKFYIRICRNLNREEQFPVFPVDHPDLMNVLKKRMTTASQLESLEHRMKKIISRENWFTKTALAADLLDDRGIEKAISTSHLKELQREKAAAEMMLKAQLAESLPSFGNSAELNTRYITPEIVKSYEKEITKSALMSLTEYETIRNDAKAKKLNYLTTRQIQKLKKGSKKKKKKGRGGKVLKRW